MNTGHRLVKNDPKELTALFTEMQRVFDRVLLC